MANVTKENVIEFISNMTVLEMSQFVKELEEKFGVTAAAPVAMAPVGFAPAASEEAAPEKTEFDVVLAEVGSQKIQVIKVVRSVTDLGLKEAKALVEEVPKPVREGISKEEAEKIKGMLEEVGARVEIK
ncbi:MAG: 50S ribosomal protein L7/L12 [Deltaproteobacteria bacterium]|nr:50S ribosomal protein L7/L12 [Deltaproteobacteria bacterium]MBW2308593.1 50S ribosomal protein L7/L12 [Deltaproteobacteria bacterium]